MLPEVITASDMKAVDKNAAFWGMSPVQLMENAGAAVSAVIADHLRASGSKKSKSKSKSGSNLNSDSNAESVLLSGKSRVLFFAGLGNNGGDTFVAARHLAGNKIPSTVILLGEKSGIKTEESAQNYAILQKEKYVSLFEIKSESELDAFFETMASEMAATSAELNSLPAVIVDGIFGTGFSGTVKGLEKKAIERINLLKAENPALFVLSVDIPSGLDPVAGLNDSDEKTIVVADTTVTFHKMKTFLETVESALFSGEVVIQPIGIPSPAEDYFGPGDLGNLYSRNAKSHKGDSGKVLIIGGGPYTGAPALSGMAALRTGADIVTVAVPAAAYEAVASFSPNLIVKKLSGNVVCEDDVPQLTDLILAHDSVVFGPGIGTDPKTVAAIAKLLPLCRKIVLDADALQPDTLAAVQKLTQKSKNETEVILTPHHGEFARILSFLKIKPETDAGAVSDADADSSETISKVCSKLGATILLKGPGDLIANGKLFRKNATGNPGMSVGGTGDVLSGIVGGFFSKNGAFESAGCGAFVCGCAGDAAFEKFGNSLLATDVVGEIVHVFCLYDPKRAGKINPKVKAELESNETRSDSEIEDGVPNSEDAVSKKVHSEADDERKFKLMEIMKKIK
ncbi:ATP-dependent (S)-NAD(P)H-hydrate dehydratase [Methanosarcinaceae archaeon Ag5]|uniref:Multifunctional fusion protein n=1 Tax=Methanolapillus africanus TaxID=3028297 RepID=A0AAE4MI54_9EURY|nr:ATP-dependent (S)-NAD(P)H-hydrate dehydratase [Methanosarcinaceae archaeon Ag5]